MQCPDDFAGRKALCPKCGQKILVPAPPNPLPTPTNKTTLGKLEDENAAAVAPMPTSAPTPLPSQNENPFAFSINSTDDAPLSDGDEGHDKKTERKPNRGVAIMVLGIVSCVCVVIALIGGMIFAPFVLLAVVSLPTGIIAWVMGNKDRKAIQEKLMSNDGYGFVLSGYICGIVGTSASGLILLLCALAALSALFCMAVWLKMIGDAAQKAPPRGF
jgi:hypothetical protein